MFGFCPVCVPLMTFYPLSFWLLKQLELSHSAASLKECYTWERRKESQPNCIVYLISMYHKIMPETGVWRCFMKTKENRLGQEEFFLMGALTSDTKLNILIKTGRVMQTQFRWQLEAWKKKNPNMTHMKWRRNLECSWQMVEETEHEHCTVPKLNYHIQLLLVTPVPH